MAGAILIEQSFAKIGVDQPRKRAVLVVDRQATLRQQVAQQVREQFQIVEEALQARKERVLRQVKNATYIFYEVYKKRSFTCMLITASISAGVRFVRTKTEITGSTRV